MGPITTPQDAVRKLGHKLTRERERVGIGRRGTLMRSQPLTLTQIRSYCSKRSKCWNAVAAMPDRRQPDRYDR
jgi:hypothetical protein